MNTLTEEALQARKLPSPAIARAIRIEAGLSQRRLAEFLGVVPVTIIRWEHGRHIPHGSLRLRYAAALEELQREVLGS